MGKTSRDKGVRGELEVVKVFKAAGLDAERSAPMQAGTKGNADVRVKQLPDLHIEVKRDERMSVDRMVAQAQAEAPTGSTPVVAYRRNGNTDWKAVVSLSFLASLLARMEA